MTKRILRTKREYGNRRYKRRFIVSTEGEKTEPQYLRMLQDINPDVYIKCLSNRKESDPEKVLLRMTNYLSSNKLENGDEAWLMVDKDDWTDTQLHPLAEWAESKEAFGLALSNPNFEYWLLLHFEDGNKVNNSQKCNVRLKKALPKYEKRIDIRKYNDSNIRQATERARRRDHHVLNGLLRREQQYTG